MDNSVHTKIDNSTHNTINIGGNNNKFGNISISSSCTLKSKIMQKIKKHKEEKNNG